jgi:ABC-type uncharacterized transport system involved in gliding motility auxiliary subunit
MEKRAKTAIESGVLLFIVAAVLVALNALSALGVYKRVDTTHTERFTLSRGSGNLLRSMKQQMTVDAYVTRGLPKLDAFVGDLRDLLQEYKQSSGGKFDFTLLEPKDDDAKKKAKDAGLVAKPFADTSDTEDKASIAEGYMGLVFHYGDEKEVIPFLPPTQTEGLEFWISNKIRELRDKGDGIKHKIGVVTGHDEIKLTEANLVPSAKGKYSLQQIISQNFPYYQFADVDLKNGDDPIDDTLDGLIITQPGKDFQDKELRRIDEFVMKGKSLVMFAGAVNVKANDATMNATLSTHGLEKLTDGYGIEMRKDAVLDFGRAFTVNMFTQSGTVLTKRFPQFPDVQDDPSFSGDQMLLDTSFAPFFRLPELSFPLSSSLVVHQEKQPDAKVLVHARTTPAAIRATTDTVDLKPIQDWKGLSKSDWGQLNLAVAVEGKVRSAFADAADKMGIEPPQSAEKARVLVVASSQFLANPLARAGNGPDMGQMGMMMPNMGGDEQLLQLSEPYAQQALTNTIVSFKDTLDYMSGDVDLLAVSAKIVSEPNLVFGDVAKPKYDPNESVEQWQKDEEARADEMRKARKSDQLRIEWVLTAGIPVLLGLLGLLRWLFRSNSRSKVSLA